MNLMNALDCMRPAWAVDADEITINKKEELANWYRREAHPVGEIIFKKWIQYVWDKGL